VLGPGGDLFQVADENGQWLYRSVPLESNNVPAALPRELSTPRFETLPVQDLESRQGPLPRAGRRRPGLIDRKVGRRYARRQDLCSERARNRLRV
jgi:hypothetical protein